MYLEVFIVFLAIAFILVTLGLFRPEHTELSVIGFVFIIFLSLQVLNGSLTMVTGTSTNSSFTYTSSGNLTLLTSSSEQVDNIYTGVQLDGYLAHIIGYWLAIGAIIGLAGVYFGFKRTQVGG